MNPNEWIPFMFAFTVSISVIFTVSGIIFKGTREPNDGQIQLRQAMIELLKFMVSASIGAMAAKM